MAIFNAQFERARREADTEDNILRLARLKGRFEVSLRYRDDKLRHRCSKMKAAGLLMGGRRDGRMLVYFPALTTQGSGE